METKEFKIQVPEGYEIDKENSTFECIKFKPIKKAMTYDDVINELFKGNDRYIYSFIHNNGWSNVVCTSSKQVEKLLAMNQLMNVAKYLNGTWSPNWEEADEKKYFIYICPRDCYTSVKSATIHMSDIVYFKSEELAKQAIKILGEQTIKTALSTDW